MSRIDELKKVINDAYREIASIQGECSHPVSCVTKKYGGDTGNWDRGDDCHWIDLHCELCNKEWRVYDDTDGDEGYRAMSMKYTREIR